MRAENTLLSDDIQDFVRSDEAARMLSSGIVKSPFPDVSPSALSVQIKGFLKSKNKLPRLSSVRGILYPKGISMEQCSGQAASFYKASIAPHGALGVDITGGFGVDAMALSRNFSHFRYFETDRELAAVAAHNFAVMGLDNITAACADGVAEVAGGTDNYDFIFADPARRDTNSSRVYRIEDCTPDIVSCSTGLLEKSPVLMVKLSPMLDIHSALASLPHTREVHTVGVRGEVRELLFVISSGYEGPAELFSADFAYEQDESPFVFKGVYGQKDEVFFSGYEKYVYDVSATLRKSGLADAYAVSLGLRKLHPHTWLYTSDVLYDGFCGRVFRVEAPVGKKDLKKLLPDSRASVISRNYPATAESLRRSFGLKDSADMFLIAFRDINNKNIVLLSTRQKFS